MDVRERDFLTPSMDATRRRYLNSTVVLSVLAGLAAAVSAIYLDGMKTKVIVVLMAALALGVGVLYFADRKNLIQLSIVFLALGIPFNLDLNLLYRAYVGVTSIDIGVTLLSALGLLVLFSYDRYESPGAEPAFRYNRTLVLALLFYMVSGVLSFYNSASFELTSLELVRLAMLFIIFFVVMNLRGRKQMSTFIIALSVGVVLETLIALYQYKTGHTLGLGVLGERNLTTLEGWFAGSRAGGTIGHPNMLAYYFEILIPLMFAMFLMEERGRLKFWYLVVTVAGIVGIIVTLSRGGWLSIPVALSIVFFTLFRHKMRKRGMLVGLFVAGIVFVVLFSYLYPTVQRRLTSADEGAAATRKPLNLAALSIIRQYPVTGVGLNNLARVFKTYDVTGGSSLFRTSTHVVHNLFLGVWAETGTIGIITFLGMFAAAIFLAAKAVVRAPPWYEAIAVGAAAGLCAQLVHGLVDPGFRILMSTSMLVYSMFGLIGAVSFLNRRKSTEEPSAEMLKS